jgi:hypothetical protein
MAAPQRDQDRDRIPRPLRGSQTSASHVAATHSTTAERELLLAGELVVQRARV